MIDPSGLATIQIGWGGTGTLGFLGGLLGDGVAIDTHGNIAFYSYAGPAAGAGLNEGAGISVQVSTAETVNDLGGWFTNASFSGGVVVGATADFFTGPSASGKVYGFGFTFGEDLGLSGLVGRTYTWLSPTKNLTGENPCP